jgi:hypothetical protein
MMLPLLLVRALTFEFVLPPIFNSVYLFRSIPIPLLSTTHEYFDQRFKMSINVESWWEAGCVYKAVSMIGTKLFLIVKKLPTSDGGHVYERIGVANFPFRGSIQSELIAFFGARVETIVLQ